MRFKCGSDPPDAGQLAGLVPTPVIMPAVCNAKLLLRIAGVAENAKIGTNPHL